MQHVEGLRRGQDLGRAVELLCHTFLRERGDGPVLVDPFARRLLVHDLPTGHRHTLGHLEVGFFLDRRAPCLDRLDLGHTRDQLVMRGAVEHLGGNGVRPCGGAVRLCRAPLAMLAGRAGCIFLFGGIDGRVGAHSILVDISARALPLGEPRLALRLDDGEHHPLHVFEEGSRLLILHRRQSVEELLVVLVRADIISAKLVVEHQHRLAVCADAEHVDRPAGHVGDELYEGLDQVLVDIEIVENLVGGVEGFFGEVEVVLRELAADPVLLIDKTEIILRLRVVQETRLHHRVVHRALDRRCASRARRDILAGLDPARAVDGAFECGAADGQVDGGHLSSSFFAFQ